VYGLQLIHIPVSSNRSIRPCCSAVCSW